jgi:hypothetical protein
VAPRTKKKRKLRREARIRAAQRAPLPTRFFARRGRRLCIGSSGEDDSEDGRAQSPLQPGKHPRRGESCPPFFLGSDGDHAPVEFDNGRINLLKCSLTNDKIKQKQLNRGIPRPKRRQTDNSLGKRVRIRLMRVSELSYIFIHFAYLRLETVHRR